MPTKPSFWPAANARLSMTDDAQACTCPGILVGRTKLGTQGNVQDIEWLHANAAACEILGVDRLQLVGGTLSQTLPDLVSTGLLGLCTEALKPSNLRRTTSRTLARTPERGGRNGVAVCISGLGDDCILLSVDLPRQAGTSGCTPASEMVLGSLAGEVLAPATTILGLADELAPLQTPGEARDRLGRLRDTADRLVGVAKDLRDFGWMADGRLVPRTVDFAPNDFIEDLVRQFAGKAASRGVVLSSRLGVLPATVSGDAARLHQVLQRLVEDALDRSAGGSISLAAVAETAEDGGLRLRVEVTAYAPPPAPPVRPTVLGLALASRAAEFLGGRAGALRLPGGGFATWLSIRVEAAETGGVPGLSVLVVEDNAATRALLSSVMERQGHRVRTSTDGLQAVVAVASERFDVVVMDMQMPELDGAEAIRLIRAMQGPAERVPIVALTADQGPEQRIRHLSTDLDAYLTKPVDWQQLDRVMRSLSRRPDVPTPPPPPPAGRFLQADTPPETVPLIDSELLTALEAAVGPVRYVELLDRFATSAEAELARLTAAQAARDVAAIRHAAHELKGVCGTFGIRRVLLLATALERSASDPAAVGPLVRQIAEALAATVAVLPRS